jgi:hypothetical protein
MPQYINPYSIKNKDELGKQHPEFGRKIGMYPKKKKSRKGELTLETILKALMGKQNRRFKKSLAKQPYRKRGIRLTDPMGERNMPPEEPASFGYAGGVLGGTGAPPGAPSSMYSELAAIGRPPMGIPEMADPYGWNPSDFSGIVEDQAARDAAALYPQPLGPDYMPMSTAPPMPTQSWNDPIPQPGEGSYMGGDWPVSSDPMAEMKTQGIPNAVLNQALNKIFSKGQY